ncbi:hypothetical protein FDP41_013462 [Naegleria fowleri]|uniref:Uncharacterized protein n=1 Tax=Naegleria fowleri TaxID=5763 RepID=A0A6A5C2Y0_NAEFO|nr:uncharacterized protein FDP41_013462 [Naegleria fowleri]KAF0980248.1 hypothetical protein FDP41_013462 [Naegleria fowleri]
MDSDYDVICKLLVIGDSSVGKSCMLLRYSDDRFLENHMATIGVDFKLKKETVGNYKAKIQIWDTGKHIMMAIVEQLNQSNNIIN